jgi:hypothetical protein
MPDEGTGTLRWSAYEHEHIERGSDWFWALGVIAVSGALTSILFGNFLFAIVVLLAATTIGLIAQKPPELHEFELTEKGIRIGQAFHPYETVISFWVDEELEKPLLLIDTTTFMSPNLIIPVAEMHPDDIRDYLRPYAQEVPMKEPIAHKILEFFGF